MVNILEEEDNYFMPTFKFEKRILDSMNLKRFKTVVIALIIYFESNRINAHTAVSSIICLQVMWYLTFVYLIIYLRMKIALEY